MRVNSIICLFLLMLSACGNEGVSENQSVDLRDVAAAVGTYSITQLQLIEVVPSGLRRDDSLAWVQNYIKNWVVDHVMLSKASWNDDEQAEIDRLVEEYRLQLIIERYQKDIIRKEFNRNISSRFFSISSTEDGDNERANIDSIADKTEREAARQVLFMKEYRDDMFKKALQNGTAVVK